MNTILGGKNYVNHTYPDHNVDPSGSTHRGSTKRIGKPDYLGAADHRCSNCLGVDLERIQRRRERREQDLKCKGEGQHGSFLFRNNYTPYNEHYIRRYLLCTISLRSN